VTTAPLASPPRLPRPTRAAGLRFRTLGGFTVWRDGAPVPEDDFSRLKARTLLGALLCAQGPVHREVLMEWLWPSLAPERALRALHSTVYSLRRALEPDLQPRHRSARVLADGEAYVLVLAQDDVWDAARFAALADDPDDESSLARLLEAEAAYTGPLLPQWKYDEWASCLREELEAMYVDVLERLARTFVDEGRLRPAVVRYRRLLALEPACDAWHRELIDLYARAGERALALRQYAACREALARVHGGEPSAATRALYGRLL
jgi:DNA-binding SARP family transcriptional activator